MKDNAFEIPFEVREVPIKRKYWFVRTFGGKLFDYYYENNIVGISGNSVPLEYVKNAPKDDVTYSTLHSYIFNNIIELQSEATKLANQLVGFYHDMQVGDIVMIPSADSDYIAFGQINSKIKVKKFEASFMHNDKVEPYPEKVRGVKWLKIMEKKDVVGDLRPIFSSHMGLTNADRFGDFIESNLSTFFVKDDYCFSTLCIDLNDDQELNVFDLNRYLEALTKLYQNFCFENEIEYNEDLLLKIKIQSSGNAIFKWTLGLGTLGIAGIIAMSLVGSDPNLELSQDKDGVKFKAELKGNYYSSKAEAEKINQETNAKAVKDSLDAEDRKLEQLNKRKQYGLLTPEEKKLYEQQLVDTAKALKMSSVESKDKNLSEVNN